MLLYSRRSYILVYSDEASAREVLCQRLVAKRNAVVEASNLPEAEAHLRGRRLDAVIVYFNESRPEQEKLQLLRQIRATRATQHLVIIAVVAQEYTSAMLQHLAESGATDAVIEPLPVEVLLARIEVHLSYQENIQQLARQNEILSDLAALDDLTRLYNRRSLLKTLSVELKRSADQNTPMAVLMIDIDHFKAVNDIYGHVVGDKTLLHVASRMQAALRQGDIIGRYGGEEFCAILPRVEIQQAILAAERLRRIVESQPARLPEIGPVSVTVSIGTCWLEEVDPSQPVQDVIARADEALYRAKNLGRNRIALCNGESELSSGGVSAILAAL